ncbi:hypothetical protein GCM10011374_03180 [Kocuria dechangensis]|uniref:Helix-turn-helix domain-containing protein n=1 Tax=Kocuria dechangensis TaxID=1176249 RepID=A0A917LN20_9MICC|nr:hypothetical protein GCM10011374_03180 [Kocuria dechangensis]
MEWFTLDEVAARYKVPKKTVYNWNTTGTGPEYIRAGRHVRYSSDSLSAWEEAQRV